MAIEDVYLIGYRNEIITWEYLLFVLIQQQTNISYVNMKLRLALDKVMMFRYRDGLNHIITFVYSLIALIQ